MCQPRFKRGMIFQNIHTSAFFRITAVRLNCGFPFYYMRIMYAEKFYPPKQRWKVDEIVLSNHYTKATKASQVLYGG